MRRTPRGKELGWHIDVPSDLAVGIDAQDLAEISAISSRTPPSGRRTSVRLCGWHDSDAIGLLVEDDGPGVPDHEVETVLARGGRLDATKPGAGLGLAIVGDLVEATAGRWL